MTGKLINRIDKAKKTSLNTRKGFSLMELMMVIVIISIMTAVIIANLNSTKSNAAFQTSTREIASAIKLAQSYALQGKTEGGTTPCGFGFVFIDSTHYQIYYNTYDSAYSNAHSLNWHDCADQNRDTNHLHFNNGASSGAMNSVVDSAYVLPSQTTLDAVSPGSLSSNTYDTDIYFAIPRASASEFTQSLGSFNTTQNVVYTLKYTGKCQTATVGLQGAVSGPVTTSNCP